MPRADGVAPIRHLVEACKEAGRLPGCGPAGRRGGLFKRGQVRGEVACAATELWPALVLVDWLAVADAPALPP